MHAIRWTHTYTHCEVSWMWKSSGHMLSLFFSSPKAAFIDGGDFTHTYARMLFVDFSDFIPSKLISKLGELGINTLCNWILHTTIHMNKIAVECVECVLNVWSFTYQKICPEIPTPHVWLRRLTSACSFKGLYRKNIFL